MTIWRCDRFRILNLTSDARFENVRVDLGIFVQRWDRLEVQHKKHVQVLGGQLAELEGEATFVEPFR